jgi:hypothetical protein
MLATALRGAALTSLLASPLAADQLTVGPAGSGAQFTEISTAVAAAQPGDRVLVAPGAYGAFLVDKAVTIVGAGHQYVIVDQGVGVAGLRVAGLAANEAAHVSGLTVRATVGESTAFPQVEVAQNAGRVVLSDVHAGTLFQPGASGFTSTPATAVITDSDAVLLDGCQLRGFQEGGGWFPLPDTPESKSALQVTGSSVWIAETTLWGQPGGGPAAPGLVATDSDVVMARSHVIGGAGAVVFCGFFGCDGTPGSPGVTLTGSSLLLAGGPGDGVFGGSGVWAQSDTCIWDCYTPGGPGVVIDGTSTVRAAAGALVEGGFGSSFSPSLAYMELAGSVLVEEAYALPTADFLPTLAAPGESVALSVSGAADAVQFAFWTPSLGPPTTLPGLAESLALPFVELNLLGVLATAGDGLGSYLTSVPLGQYLAGARLVVQTVEVGPNGLLLSNPTTLAIR